MKHEEAVRDVMQSGEHLAQPFVVPRQSTEPRLIDDNYFSRRVASPFVLPKPSRCLTPMLPRSSHE